MKKEIKVLNGKRHYLLGVRKEDGLKVWLQAPSWDCGWYWGFGYIKVYSKNQKTLYEHTHFDSLFFNGKKSCYDLVKEYFKELTISNSELWSLLDYMQTFYTLRKASDTFHIGGSHISSNLNYKCKNNEMYELVNKSMLPKIFEEIENILL